MSDAAVELMVAGCWVVDCWAVEPLVAGRLIALRLICERFRNCVKNSKPLLQTVVLDAACAALLLLPDCEVDNC